MLNAIILLRREHHKWNVWEEMGRAGVVFIKLRSEFSVSRLSQVTQQWSVLFCCFLVHELAESTARGFQRYCSMFISKVSWLTEASPAWSMIIHSEGNACSLEYLKIFNSLTFVDFFCEFHDNNCIFSKGLFVERMKLTQKKEPFYSSAALQSHWNAVMRNTRRGKGFLGLWPTLLM